MKRVAICLKGAVSKEGSDHDRFYNINDVYRPGNYINYRAVGNSVIKHIVQANPNYTFDFFLHGWNYELQDELVDLYKPKKYMFEDNNIYNDLISSSAKYPSDYGGVSGSLSLKKSLELKEEYEISNGIKYNIVIVYRYDVLLWKNMTLSFYDTENSMYVNGWDGRCLADFHFVMSNEISKKFKYLFDSILNNNNIHKFHSWIYNYVVNFMKCNLKEDLIKAGKNQEHMRVIFANPKKFLFLTNKMEQEN